MTREVGVGEVGTTQIRTERVPSHCGVVVDAMAFNYCCMIITL